MGSLRTSGSNFWIDGTPYWSGVQLDEAAFPIILARKLHRIGGLQDFDPYPMVLRGAAYLIMHGPITQQERWEEASGYSPSTLAAVISALICAACFAREHGHLAAAEFLEEHADFLESHLEQWTVTTEGTLVPGIREHYVRIRPAACDDIHPEEGRNLGTLALRNQAPGDRYEFPASEIVDGGFLELVRYGIRAADDPVILNTIKVMDAVLKVETPFGPCWRRYNHDGYGQNADGGPFLSWGIGRAWPLLTGERGHYEIAAGRDPAPYIQAMEGFASPTGLLPEQVWDQEALPDEHMYFGEPTGAAMPLMWAHAEYIKLLRSACDGQVFDMVPEVAQRYLGERQPGPSLEIWKQNRQPRRMHAGQTLRVEALEPFTLHWSADDWQTIHDSASSTTELGIHFVDVPIGASQHGSIRFTFFWLPEGRWEGQDYEVGVEV